MAEQEGQLLPLHWHQHQQGESLLLYPTYSNAHPGKTSCFFHQPRIFFTLPPGHSGVTTD